MAASAALVISQCGCIAAQRSSPAGRDADGRAIGADVGAAKGNATTQPVNGDGAVGQVGGVNAAFTYASAGLGVGAVVIVCIVLFTNLFGDMGQNGNTRAEIASRERVELRFIDALETVATDAIALASEVIRGKAA